MEERESNIIYCDGSKGNLTIVSTPNIVLGLVDGVISGFYHIKNQVFAQVTHSVSDGAAFQTGDVSSENSRDKPYLGFSSHYGYMVRPNLLSSKHNNLEDLPLINAILGRFNMSNEGLEREIESSVIKHSETILKTPQICLSESEQILYKTDYAVEMMQKIVNNNM